jgi:hypothetical protein
MVTALKDMLAIVKSKSYGGYFVAFNNTDLAHATSDADLEAYARANSRR